MTYGEYFYHIKYNMNMELGKWKSNKPHITVPKRMPREKAIKYYTNKLSKYWESVCKGMNK